MAKTKHAFPSDPRWTRAVELPAIPSRSAFSPLFLPAAKHIFINGLPRGSLVEIGGARSSGKSSICLHILASATQLGEVCAVVDFAHNFHPDSARACGVRLSRLLWVRSECDPSHTMKIADLLLHAGGFGVVLLDLSEMPPKTLNQIPISYWYRFQRALQNTPTILLVCSQTPQAKAASRLSLFCQTVSSTWLGQAPFSRLSGICAKLQQRKLSAPPCSETLKISLS